MERIVRSRAISPAVPCRLANSHLRLLSQADASSHCAGLGLGSRIIRNEKVLHSCCARAVGGGAHCPDSRAIRAKLSREDPFRMDHAVGRTGRYATSRRQHRHSRARGERSILDGSTAEQGRINRREDPARRPMRPQPRCSIRRDLGLFVVGGTPGHHRSIVL